MDRNQFAANAPGQLIGLPNNDWAFLPRQLPPEWEFPVRLWPLLADVRQQVGLLEGIGRTLPNPMILLRPLTDREALRSSSLEGTYATPKELLLFELHPREADSDSDPSNDHREVFNYRRALNHGMTTDLPVSLRFIRNLHAILLEGVRGRDKAPGEFRQIQVAIGANHRFVPPPPGRLMECLDPLERYLHTLSGKFDPLVHCFLIHYQFETIHPFNDGNGRVGRLLLAIMLKERCGLSKPWLTMSEYYERNRDEYFQRLFEVSANARWEDWIEFCLRGTLQHAQETIARCQRLQAIREEFLKRLATAGGDVRLHQIVEDIFISPFVRVADLPDRLGITYPTAKADLERLAKVNIVRELKNTSPKTYFAPEVFNIAYEDLEVDDA